MNKIANKMTAYFPWFASLLALLFVKPFLDAPLNDDWQYAWVAKRFAETGHFIIDVPVAPTLLGQSIMAWPFLKIFSFSFFHLRIVTLIFSALLIFLYSKTLKNFGVSRQFIVIGQLLIIFNPIFTHVSVTFMTEVYGYLFSFLLIYLFFVVKPKIGENWIYKITYLLVVGFVAGLAYLTRQFCILVIPAAWLAHFISNRRIRLADFIEIFSTLAISGTIIYLYYNSVLASESNLSAFKSPLLTLTEFHVTSLFTQLIVGPYYLTLFCFPIFIYLIEKPISVKRPKANLFNFLIVVFFLSYLVNIFGFGENMPYFVRSYKAELGILPNIIHKAGLGPITTSVTFNKELNLEFGMPPWLGLSLFSLLSIMALIVILKRKTIFKDLFKPSPHNASDTFQIFCFVSAIIFWISSVLVYKNQVFDRYLLGSFLMLMLYFPIQLQKRIGTRPEINTRWIYCGIATLVIFTLVGTHDYFRWNETRWKIVQSLLGKGVKAENIDGGYEVNGWLFVPSTSSKGPYMVRNLQNCQGYNGWHCRSTSYIIDFKCPMPSIVSYEEIPSTILKYPSLKLCYNP